MFSKVMSCRKCGLHENQLPLVDKKCKADVIWVGLSAKSVENFENDIPLSCNTNSGKLINQIEINSIPCNFYKTNLVKCVPLNECGKLRYPDTHEKGLCFNNLIYEIESLNPTLIFLLGKEVANFVFKKYGLEQPSLEEDFNYIQYSVKNLNLIPIHHPSFITIYKRKYIDNYISSITSIIENAVSLDYNYIKTAI